MAALCSALSYLCNDLRVHRSVIIEAFWPSCCYCLPDLGTVKSILQGWVAADGVETPMPTDGTLIWSFLRETLAHDGLRRWTAARPRGGRVRQGTAQPMAVTPKCFPDAPWFWSLSLPSIANKKGNVTRESWAMMKLGQVRGADDGTQGLLEGEDVLSSVSLLSVSQPPPSWAKEKCILTWWSWALCSQDARCCQEKCWLSESF